MSVVSRRLVTVAVLAALVAPVALDRDGIPLSTYPMYSRARSSTVAFVTAHGLDAAGTVHPLSLGAIGDSDDPLIVAGELRSAIRAGRADERCLEIAERIGGDHDPELVGVEVVTERHDVIAHVEGDNSLIEREVHATCGVTSATATT